jgi:hypothetical protein
VLSLGKIYLFSKVRPIIQQPYLGLGNPKGRENYRAKRQVTEILRDKGVLEIALELLANKTKVVPKKKQ